MYVSPNNQRPGLKALKARAAAAHQAAEKRAQAAANAAALAKVAGK